MHNRDAFLLWGEISRLVDASLGLSMLADYDCAGVINNEKERELASGATGTAAVILLRKAAELLISLEQHINKVPCSEDAPT
ncbi:hypothetical protein [Dechloromonas denitrificans]|uniref:hypothetical protein n=1 Tax=Dechloromonas denitrificans TaxID=281362 RepID=UPI001CFB0630|nr:hypothetical protein [Dechloromonas denitrificans]UCV08471.1 hypothetical protein KI615_02765 [Dechloromonas denitrificans]